MRKAYLILSTAQDPKAPDRLSAKLNYYGVVRKTPKADEL